jgi:hypothetical protein
VSVGINVILEEQVILGVANLHGQCQVARFKNGVKMQRIVVVYPVKGRYHVCATDLFLWGVLSVHFNLSFGFEKAHADQRRVVVGV